MKNRAPKLIIIRGTPGSGKSTYAKQLSEKSGVAHFENDEYLMHNGKYDWTPDNAKHAVAQCFKDTIDTIRSGKDAIVSNVFVTKKSIDRYVNAAKALGAQVLVLRKTSQYKNVHDVPDNVFNSMKKSFEDYPGERLVP